MSHTHFRVNPHSIVARMSRNSCLKQAQYLKFKWLQLELNNCGFEPCCSHLNFRYRICFEQDVPWHSGNYRVWIRSAMHMWHGKNIQSNAQYRSIIWPVWLNGWVFIYELSGWGLSPVVVTQTFWVYFFLNWSFC